MAFLTTTPMAGTGSKRASRANSGMPATSAGLGVLAGFAAELDRTLARQGGQQPKLAGAAGSPQPATVVADAVPIETGSRVAGEGGSPNPNASSVTEREDRRQGRAAVPVDHTSEPAESRAALVASPRSAKQAQRQVGARRERSQAASEGRARTSETALSDDAAAAVTNKVALALAGSVTAAGQWPLLGQRAPDNYGAAPGVAAWPDATGLRNTAEGRDLPETALVASGEVPVTGSAVGPQAAETAAMEAPVNSLWVGHAGASTLPAAAPAARGNAAGAADSGVRSTMAAANDRVALASDAPKAATYRQIAGELATQPTLDAREPRVNRRRSSVPLASQVDWPTGRAIPARGSAAVGARQARIDVALRWAEGRQQPSAQLAPEVGGRPAEVRVDAPSGSVAQGQVQPTAVAPQPAAGIPMRQAGTPQQPLVAPAEAPLTPESGVRLAQAQTVAQQPPAPLMPEGGVQPSQGRVDALTGSAAQAEYRQQPPAPLMPGGGARPVQAQVDSLTASTAAPQAQTASGIGSAQAPTVVAPQVGLGRRAYQAENQQHLHAGAPAAKLGTLQPQATSPAAGRMALQPAGTEPAATASELSGDQSATAAPAGMTQPLSSRPEIGAVMAGDQPQAMLSGMALHDAVAAMSEGEPVRSAPQPVSGLNRTPIQPAVPVESGVEAPDLRIESAAAADVTVTGPELPTGRSPGSDRLDRDLDHTGHPDAKEWVNSTDGPSEAMAFPVATWNLLEAQTVLSSGEVELAADAEVSQWDRLAWQIEQAALQTPDGAAKLRIRVYPASLGEVQLEVEMRENRLATRFVAASEGARALIEAGLPHLKRRLEAEGIVLRHISLEVAERPVSVESVWTGTSWLAGSDSHMGGSDYRAPMPVTDAALSGQANSFGSGSWSSGQNGQGWTQDQRSSLFYAQLWLEAPVAETRRIMAVTNVGERRSLDLRV